MFRLFQVFYCGNAFLVYDTIAQSKIVQLRTRAWIVYTGYFAILLS